MSDKNKYQTHCAFCGKDKSEVNKLIASDTTSICDECVRKCELILEDNSKQKNLNESTIKNVDIIEKTKNKYRVIIGPYMDLKSLQKDYNKLEKLNFENIQIINNV